MRSLHTNVVVRLFVFDDEQQSATASALLGSPILLLSTVMMEAIWVLQHRYELPIAEIADGLSVLIDTQGVVIENPTAVQWALERFRRGADFADMLHLALSHTADKFTTFDRRIARFASSDVVNVETLA